MKQTLRLIGALAVLCAACGEDPEVALLGEAETMADEPAPSGSELNVSPEHSDSPASDEPLPEPIDIATLTPPDPGATRRAFGQMHATEGARELVVH